MSAQGSLVLDASVLQRRAMELLAEVDEDPKRGAARVAAAEAHLRLVIAGAPRDKATKLLERAIDLDPYRAEAYLLAALTSHRAGYIAAALERYEQAAAVAPSSVMVRFHCGFGFLDAARDPSLPDDEAAELAEVAAEHFEAVLGIDPKHGLAAIGAVESAVYGKATKLRDSLTRVFSRVTPTEALRPTMTRLLYQAIFAFRVGKAKQVDQKNKKTMGEVADVARAWLEKFPADRGLLGVVAASTAKCESPEDLCAHLAEHAAAIPDVRVLRLLLRERLAEVTDPAKRLELLAGAMEHIPALDGIAHDYLQMLHLVAKRAVAEGDLPAAREAWERCQTLDTDSPAVVQNLLRLAQHEGDADLAARLERQLFKLWELYVDVSPRPELILARAAAKTQISVEADLEAIGDRLEKTQKKASAAQMNNLVLRWVWAQALGRLAVEPALLADVGPGLAKTLLSTSPEDALPLALPILERPLPGEPPIAYAYLFVAKDASEEDLAKARDGWQGEIEKAIAERQQLGVNSAAHEVLLEKAKKATRVLFDADARATYDDSTCPTPQAEMYRRHTELYRQLVELCVHVEDEDPAARAPLEALLKRIPTEILQHYLSTTMRDEDWVKVTMLRVRYMGLIAKGWKLLEDGQGRAALDLCSRHLAGAADLAAAHRLYASAMLEDEGGSVWQTVDKALDHARKAIMLAHWSDPLQVVADVQQFAQQPPENLAQRVASTRAGKLLEKDLSRDAVVTLWSAYPGHRHERVPSMTPAGRMFMLLHPKGSAGYAFRVAQAIRENVIAWFNAQRPSSYYEHGQLKASARDLTVAATRWARYALDSIRRDPDRPPGSEQIMNVIMKLISALEADGGRLS